MVTTYHIVSRNQSRTFAGCSQNRAAGTDLSNQGFVVLLPATGTWKNQTATGGKDE